MKSRKPAAKSSKPKAKPIPIAPFKTELVPISSLHSHPQNYREHPDDQVEHLVKSLSEHGVYRNIVATKDGTILAGHGVYKAAAKLGLKDIPIIRLNLNPNDPQAIKILIGDNEIEHLAEQNDRLLADLLKQLKDETDLLGTGFDDMMLANFLMVTRPKSEIKDFNEAAEWIGMPEYNLVDEPLKLVLVFRNQKDRTEAAEKLGLTLTLQTRSAWYPPRPNEDPKSIKFEAS